AEAEAEAESTFQSEEDRLAGIMATQPIDETIDDRNIDSKSPEIAEPVSEIEKLRAKLRERTQRLKAARKQHLDHAQSTPEQPSNEKSVKAESSNEKSADEMEVANTIEQPVDPFDSMNIKHSLDSSAEVEVKNLTKPDNSDIAEKNDPEKSKEANVVLTNSESENNNLSTELSQTEMKADNSSIVKESPTSTGNTSSNNSSVLPQLGNHTFAFEGMPEFIEEEIELSTANGYRMHSSQELISELKKAPLIPMGSPDADRNESSKSNFNNEVNPSISSNKEEVLDNDNNHKNDNEWVADLLNEDDAFSESLSTTLNAQSFDKQDEVVDEASVKQHLDVVKQDINEKMFAEAEAEA
ncbi:hypothetical protein, partial [Methylophaga sp. UBA2689]|uniref:hypothetical protein n=1 Tax=Methylophaga sp. UBA2689 TaxID=1946878 RepID=UPI0025F988E1